MRRALLLLLLLPFAFASVVSPTDYYSQCAHLGCPDASRSLYVLSSSGGPLEAIYIPESGSAVVTFYIKNYDVRHTGYVCIEGHGVYVSAENYEGEICFPVSPGSTVPVTLSVRAAPGSASGGYVGDIYVYLSGAVHRVSVYLGAPPAIFGIPVYVFAVVFLLLLLAAVSYYLASR